MSLDELTEIEWDTTETRTHRAAVPTALLRMVHGLTADDPVDSPDVRGSVTQRQSFDDILAAFEDSDSSVAATSERSVTAVREMAL